MENITEIEVLLANTSENLSTQKMQRTYRKRTKNQGAVPMMQSKTQYSNDHSQTSDIQFNISNIHCQSFEKFIWLLGQLFVIIFILTVA